MAAEQMPRCRDCRWWEASALDSSQRFCDLATSDESVALHAGTLAWADATDGGEAVFVTSPDFGCVQFQPKEPPA